MTHMVVHPCRVNTIDSLVLSNIMSYYPIMLQFNTNWWWQKNELNWFKKMDDGIHFPHPTVDMAMGHINIQSTLYKC